MARFPFPRTPVSPVATLQQRLAFQVLVSSNADVVMVRRCAAHAIVRSADIADVPTALGSTRARREWERLSATHWPTGSPPLTGRFLPATSSAPLLGEHFCPPPRGTFRPVLVNLLNLEKGTQK